MFEKEAEDFLKKSLKVDDDEFDFFKNEASCKEEIKRLTDFIEPREKRIAELEHQLTHRNCVDCSNHSSKLRMRTLELEKENAELKEKVSFLEDNLRVARKDREDLQLDVAKGLKEFVKDYPATALRYLANEKYVEQLTKAKNHIKKLLDCLKQDTNDPQTNYYVVQYMTEAEQFISEVEK